MRLGFRFARRLVVLETITALLRCANLRGNLRQITCANCANSPAPGDADQEADPECDADGRKRPLHDRVFQLLLE